MAIKHNELRIGNLVQDEHEIVQYVYRLWQGGAELAEDENGGEDLDHTNEEMFGIPISPDWLEKFGFKNTGRTNEVHYRLGRFNWYSSCNEVSVEFESSVTGDYSLDTDCKFVHQLQNLYFVIEGLELELKERGKKV